MSETTRLSDGPFGARGKRLAELSDAELTEEAARRRRARGGGPAGPTPSGATRPPVPADLRRYFANLELDPSASLAEVKAAYERLEAKYDPSRFAGDSAQHRTAVELVASLRRAYEALSAHLGRRGRS